MSRKQLASLLYVDDEQDIREIVQMALGAVGNLTVHTCESGSQALELLPKIKPDLVLLDVMMSGMDGLATLARMRADAALAQIPVVFMTAKVMPQEVARFKALGAIGVISKPFDPMKLSQQVLALWDSSPEVADPLPVSLPPERTRQLAAQFLTRTSQDANSIQQLALQATSGDSAAFAKLEKLAHRISGAGATLGFPQISNCAAEVERLAKQQPAQVVQSGADDRLVDTSIRLVALVQQIVADNSERA